MRASRRAGVVLAWVLLFNAQAAASEVQRRVRADDVDAGALLQVLADVADANIILARGSLKPRLTVAIDASSPAGLLAAAATQAGASFDDRSGILVSGPPCAAQHTLAGDALTERISLNFQNIDSTTLLVILQDFGVQFEPRVKDDAAPGVPITIRVKSRLVQEVLSALTAAPGKQRNDEACASGEGAVPLRVGNWRERQAAAPCPYRKGRDGQPAHAKCTPLERNALHTMVPKGYVRLHDKLQALLETDEGLLYRVRVGDYVGRDYGQVTAITEQGLTIKEVDLDEEGKVQPVSRSYRYGERPAMSRMTTHQAYVEVDSPQAQYDEALLEVAMFARWMTVWVDECSRSMPDTASAAQTALAAWRQRNTGVLNEIERHASTAIARERVDAVPLSKGFEATRDQLAHRISLDHLINPPNGASHGAWRCSGIPASLRSTRFYLDTKYAAQMDLLRRCEAEGTCEGLRAKAPEPPARTAP